MDFQGLRDSQVMDRASMEIRIMGAHYFIGLPEMSLILSGIKKTDACREKIKTGIVPGSMGYSGF